MNTKNSVFVDTSGWAAPVMPDTDNYEAMDRFSRELINSGRQLITTNYVIAELVALLTIRTRMPRSEILRFVNQVKQLAHIVYVDATLDDTAWTLLEHYTDKDWSLADAASFVAMRQLNITEAFTSDQHFNQAGFIRVPAM